MSEPGINKHPTSLPSEEYKVMVLLVDDQLLIGEAIRRALTGQSDIHFHYIADPRDAVRVAEQIRPTVILQDLVMPGVSGLSLLSEYQANPALRDIPVIVLSTKEEPAVKSEAFSLGASDYLVKLPDSVELLARIRHHSRAYLNQIQRDQAFRALHESQQELVEKNFELERLTQVDGLTGLSNRRYMDEFIDIQWSGARRKGESCAVLMMDVDDFKHYNDCYGHLAGDEVLKTMAALLRGCCRRPTELAARFGGDEFMVVYSPASLEDIKEFGERLRSKVEQTRLPHAGSSVAEVVTVSIGGALLIPQRDNSSFTLIQMADDALYQAKRSGKNRLVVSVST